MEELRSLLSSTTLQVLIRGKENLAEVPYKATVAKTLRVMGESNIDAIPVALPHLDGLNTYSSSYSTKHSADWMMKQQMALDDVMSFSPDQMQQGMANGIILNNGSAHDRYSGIVTIFDILSYFAKLLSMNKDANTTMRFALESPIHCCIIERKNISVMSSNTSALEAMERMINGVQVALVFHKSKREAPKVSYYTMITQMDMVQFIKAEAKNFEPILSQSVKSLNAMRPGVCGVWKGMAFFDMIKCMHQALVSVVPIIECPEEDIPQTAQLLDATGRMIIGTFAASDLKGCPLETLDRWATEGVLAFLKRVIVMRKATCSIDTLEADPDVMYEADLVGSYFQFDHVSCLIDSPIGEVIDSALQNNTHKVWVVENDSLLVGVVCISDILRVVRKCIDT